jgi:hypothetical protein
MSRISSVSGRAVQDTTIDHAVSTRLNNVRRIPLSLRPDARLIEAAAMGSPLALEIARSWRFQQPVRLMDSHELEELCARCSVTFVGRASELAVTSRSAVEDE